MPFPFVVKYNKVLKAEITDARIPASFEYVERYIRERSGENIVTNGNLLMFEVDFLRMRYYGNDVLRLLDKGSFSITNENGVSMLSYEFFMYKSFLFFFIPIIIFVTLNKNIDVWPLIYIYGLGLGIGIHWLIVIIRQRLMFLKIVKGIENIWR